MSVIRAGAVASALLLALASGIARAHEQPEIDLTPLSDHAVDMAAATAAGDRRIHAAWVRLAKRLLEEDVPGLADDLRKLGVVRKATAGPLAADTMLRTLLGNAMDGAEDALRALPSDVEERIDAVEEKGHPRLERMAVRARAAFLDGKHTGSDVAKRIRLWRSAATGFRKADAAADRAIERQGGPVATAFAAEPDTIYTVAGTGAGGFNGDGRPARRSSLYWVEEIKFAPDGRLHLLDWNNHMLRRLEADGTLSRVCGAGLPGDSEGDPLLTQLNHPSAMDFDAQGRIYIAAWHNHKVKVYDPTGPSPTVYTIAGTVQGNAGDGGPATAAKFNLLPGVLLLPPGHPLGGGDLLATDAANQCVRVIRLASDPMTATNVAGVSVQTGSVDRFWGTGTQGHDGDDGPAADARLGFSKAQNAESDGRMALDGDGNVYVVSGVEHVIRRIATDGTITTVAGNGTAGYSGDGGRATSAQLDFPSDVAVAADGTLYVSDQNNHVVRRVDPDGDISTFVGDGTGVQGYSGDGGAPGDAKLHRPTGLELDAAGNLWICDKENSVVRVVTSGAPGGLMVPRTPYTLPVAALGKPPKKGPSGTIDTYAGTGTSAFTGDGKPALETDFYWPQDVAVQPGSGLLYVVDWNNHRIRRVEDDGTVRTVVGLGELGDTNGPALTVRMNHPTDIAFGPLDGDLYIATWHTDKVKRVLGSTNEVVAVNKPDGKRTFSGEDGPVSLAELNLPSSAKFDSLGNMFIGDEGNRRVRRVDAGTQLIDTIIGTGAAGFFGDDGPGTSAMLNLPVGQSAQPAGKVCVDPTDAWLYVADTDNHRVRRLDLQSGTITTVAGNGTAAYAGDGGAATAASLSSPVDVDCDAAGNLYICDRDNHAIRRVDHFTGIITTVAGTGGAEGYDGDGGAATAATLNLPGGIFVDRTTGRLYVADTINSVVRVVWE
jgi:sugar lactone lactonase YvrE